MLCFSSARTLVSLWYQGSEKSGFLGSVHDMCDVFDFPTVTVPYWSSNIPDSLHLVFLFHS